MSGKSKSDEKEKPIEKPHTGKRLIRLDDLMPKQTVSGGRHIVFGNRPNQNNKSVNKP